jgi:hypothetical protein
MILIKCNDFLVCYCSDIPLSDKEWPAYIYDIRRTDCLCIAKAFVVPPADGPMHVSIAIITCDSSYIVSLPDHLVSIRFEYTEADDFCRIFDRLVAAPGITASVAASLSCVLSAVFKFADTCSHRFGINIAHCNGSIKSIRDAHSDFFLPF